MFNSKKVVHLLYNQKTKNKMTKEIKFILGVIILFIIIGLVGESDYQLEKTQESVIITKTK